MESTSDISRGSEVEALHDLATILNTGLSRKVLAVVLELIESGVSPESIADGMTINHLMLANNLNI